MAQNQCPDLPVAFRLDRGGIVAQGVCHRGGPMRGMKDRIRKAKPIRTEIDHKAFRPIESERNCKYKDVSQLVIELSLTVNLPG